MFLTEALNYNTEEEIIVEPTNEGYSFEYGGLERVQDLMEADTTAISMAENVEEVRVCNIIHEANMRMKNGDVSGHMLLMESAEELSEATIKSVFDAIIGAIKKAWARVKEVMKSIIAYFSGSGSNKESQDKAKSVISSTDFNVAGLEFEGYKYNLEQFDALKSYKDMIREVNSKFNNVEKSVIEAKDDTSYKKASDELNVNNSIETFDQIIKIGYGCIFKDIKDHLYTKLRGSKEKVKIIVNKELCDKTINGYNEATSRIKTISIELDKMYTETIKYVEEAKKSNLLSVKDDIRKQTLLKSVYVKKANIFKKLLDVSQNTCSIYISILKEERELKLRILFLKYYLYHKM